VPAAAVLSLGLVLLAAAAFGTARAASQTDFPEPSEFVSENGVLHGTLTAEETAIELTGMQVQARVYNGAFVGPTLRVRPGDRIELELVNNLSEMTNIHVHGLHVSPGGESDNIFREIMAGETGQVVVDLPADHPTGTFWYHSHAHGISEEQIFGGMSGLIVVEGLADLLPDELSGIEQRTFALKDFQLQDGAIVSENIDSNAGTTRTVNGVVNPSLSIAPGETQLWGLANIGADIWYELSLDGHQFQVVGEDGNPVWEVHAEESLVLPPGKRYDVLVQGGEAGMYQLRTLAFDQGGDWYPEVPLAMLEVTGSAGTPATLPTALIEPNDLDAATVAQQRTIVFTEDEDTQQFMIDGKQFDPNRVDQQVQLGTVEEWTVRNDTGELHPFHIHINDFQVMSINGQPYEARSLQDTIPLPIHGEVVVRIPFEDFTGKFVFHCHIENHADNGMMSVVEVIDGPIATPAATPEG
jgi:FtsP/CotA-like multicopper oxidase with cupredoxin domain